jgi:hypothetical protein
MDVKPSALYAPVIIPEAYRRPAQTLQRVSQPLGAVCPEDVIDCVEVQADGYQAANSLKTVYERRPDKPMIEKGKLLDIWI